MLIPSKIIEKKYIHYVAVGILFLLALFFATYQLTESPSFWYDEGWYYQSAANLASEGVFGLQLSPGNTVHISMYQTVSYPLIYPLALWLKVFGISVLSGRSLMVVFILSLLVVSYLLSKRLFGYANALGVLALLATFAPLYGNGKSILGEVPGILYLFLFLLFFNISRHSSNKKFFWVALSGLSAGLCVATKPFFILLLPAIVVGMFIAYRRKYIDWRDIVTGVVSFLVPMIAWLFIQFQSSDSIQQVITYYANPYAFADPGHTQGVLITILQSVKSLFTNVSTLYTILLLAVWLVAVIARWRDKKQISIEEIIAFAFSIIVMLSFLRIGGIFRYFFPAQIVILAFFPSALWLVADYICNKFQSIKKLKNLASIVLVVVIAILSLLGVYQLSFSSWVAEAYGSHKTHFWQEYFSKVATTTSVFFYDTPEVVPFVQSRNYYQSLLTPRINAIGKEYISLLKSGDVDMVIVETSKYGLLKDTVFGKYIVGQTAYKYSILKLK